MLSLLFSLFFFSSLFSLSQYILFPRRSTFSSLATIAGTPFVLPRGIGTTIDLIRWPGHLSHLVLCRDPHSSSINGEGG